MNVLYIEAFITVCACVSSSFSRILSGSLDFFSFQKLVSECLFDILTQTERLNFRRILCLSLLHTHTSIHISQTDAVDCHDGISVALSPMRIPYESA